MDFVQRRLLTLRKIIKSCLATKCGFTLTELLIILAVLLITAAGGLVVWEKKARLTVTPKPTPSIGKKLTPIPTLPETETTKIPWEDSVCGNGICEPCENECCNYPCNPDGSCPPPTCLGYCLKDCQSVPNAPIGQKFRLSTGQTVNITGANLSLTLLKITSSPPNCYDCPTTAEIEIRSGTSFEKIYFISGVLATEEVEAELRTKEVFGFKITCEELRSEWIILTVQKL